MTQATSRIDEHVREAAAETVAKAQQYMLNIQYEEGYWWGELESNPTMEAEYLMLTHILGAPDPERWRKIANYILGRQKEDGSWAQYYGAPGNLSTCVECYTALKMAGIPTNSPAMTKAREFILSKGGIPNTRVFTKIWLAMLGQYPWKNLPAMPPEVMFLPTWFPLNIYEFSSWARATIVPMTIILTEKPTVPIPEFAAIPELFPRQNGHKPPSNGLSSPIASWRTLFNGADKVLRLYEKVPIKPGRVWAKGLAAQWILARQEADGSWGGIQPPWVYSLICLKHLGYPLDHPAMKMGLQGFEGFAIEEDDTWRVQACISPVWDTCLALIAMLESGIPPDNPAMESATRWLIDKQILRGGDWQVKAPETPPGGWAFEFANNNYPDIDDVSEVLIALKMARLPGDEDKCRVAAVERGVSWLLGVQSANGGWAAFDKDNDRTYLSSIPFADFGESLDPPSVDVTAHVVEAFGKLGYDRTFEPIQRAYDYIRADQEEDGPWFGRWGVNYIYGVGAVLPALQAIGEDMSQPFVRKAVAWLMRHQNADGGWGESCGSYVDPSLRGKGPSTASQTAWALLALIAAGEAHSPEMLKGIRYLHRTQQADGSWDEPYFTGTGFPGYGVGHRPKKLPDPGDPSYQDLDMGAGFMINYHLYRNYWPLTALGRFLNGG